MPEIENQQVEFEELRDEDRVLLIFAYMGPLALVSLAAGRSDFVKWHAKQGLLISLTTVATFVILRPVHWLFYKIWIFLGHLFLTTELLILIGFLIVAMMCLVRALEGERFRLPLLGELADRL